MIGILICGRFTGVPLAVAGGDYDWAYEKIFSTADPSIDLRFYYAIDGDLPTTPYECDSWVVGGSRTSAMADEPWLDDLRAFIRTAANAKVRMVGLCFGHQIIAQALGGAVEKAPAWTSSVQPLSIDQQPWFPGGLIPLQAMHEDQVTRLPAGGRVVGSGTTCEIPAMMIDDHIFSIQYHPEIDADLAEVLIEKIGDGLTPEARAQALESLSIPTDRVRMAKWVLRFLRDERQQLQTTN